MDGSPTIHNSVLPEHDSALSRESLASMTDVDFSNSSNLDASILPGASRPSLAFRRSSDFRAENVAAKLSLTQRGSDHDLLRATFIMWKNYTSIKANRRMKKSIEEAHRV